MRLMAGVTQILTLCVLVLPAIAAAQGSVTLQPNQGTVNTGVTAIGAGWPPNASVHAFFNLDQQPLNPVPKTVDSSGGFTLPFCVPNQPPGIYPTFFTISQFPGMYSGPIFTITAGTPGNCQPTATCPDVYFVGVHGTNEGPDLGGNGDSPVIRETWDTFNQLAQEKGKRAQYHSVWYNASVGDLLAGAVDPGVERLDQYIRNQVLSVCPTQSIVLVGYSLGAWIIDDWLRSNEDVWPNIVAVELYGDPIWHRTAHAYLDNSVVTYDGIARRLGLHLGAAGDRTDPYTDNQQGPGVGLSDRWQSRCLKGDPVCGEGYNETLLSTQSELAVNCASNLDCEHRKYSRDEGYNLTERGAHFLALKAFPQMPASAGPEVKHVETFREGELVFFRLYYTDPNNEVNGFGFVGVNGAGWGETELPFSPSPVYGRLSPGRIEYPFNHRCGTSSELQSDIEAWVVVFNPDGSIRDGSPGVDIHLECNAPCEVVTSYYNFTWDDMPSSPESCQAGIAR